MHGPCGVEVQRLQVELKDRRERVKVRGRGHIPVGQPRVLPPARACMAHDIVVRQQRQQADERAIGYVNYYRTVI